MIRPESSARAGRPVCRQALRAFSSAFSTKVWPVSSASAKPKSDCGTASKPASARIGRISASLPLFEVARTRRTQSAAARGPLQRQQFADALAGQVEQAVQVRARERRAFGGALHFDEAAVAVQPPV